jgi:multidrug resistance efflux pump
MKKTSFLFLGLVIVLFLILQGWFLSAMFLQARTFTSVQAVISGESTEVRSPLVGFVKNIMVADQERVLENQQLFTVTQLVSDPITQQMHEEDYPVLALQSGIVTDLSVKKGEYVQVNELLATLVDNSPDSLYVQAKLHVPPKYVTNIKKLLSAKVTADYLYGGKPMEAMISSVDPVYDAQGETIDVRLKLFQYPDNIDSLPLGLPATVTVYDERAADENFVTSMYHRLFSSSQ